MKSTQKSTKHLSLNSTTKCFKIRFYIVRSLQQWAFFFVKTKNKKKLSQVLDKILKVGIIERVKKLRSVGQGVKTPPFHGGNTGSNPVRTMGVSRLKEIGFKKS